MSDFTIQEVLAEERFATANGEFVAYTVAFDGEQGRGIAQHKRKAASPAPTAGEVIDAEIVQKNGKTELKRIWQQGGTGAPSAGGNGGGRSFQRDPKDTAQIVRQHSQTAAVYWLAVLQKAGKLSNPTEGQLKATIDWFDADVRENAGTA